jgi:hypothetical protein
VTCTTYAVFGTKVEYQRLVEASDELCVVTCGVVTNKIVEVVLKIVFLDNVKYNRGLGAACMITEEVVEGDKQVLLLVVSI